MPPSPDVTNTLPFSVGFLGFYSFAACATVIAVP